MAEDKRPGAGMESQGGQGILSSFANKLRAYTGPLTTPKAAAIHIPASGHELPGKHTPEVCMSPSDMGIWDFFPPAEKYVPPSPKHRVPQAVTKGVGAMPSKVQ